MKQSGSSSSATGTEDKNFWGKLWKVEYVPKVKQFLWRLAHNSLPLRLNIARRRMGIDTRSPVCGCLDEDGGYCFLKCKHVRKCWQGQDLEGVRLHLIILSSAREVVYDILNMPKGL